MEELEVSSSYQKQAVEENFIIKHIKYGLKSQAEKQARLERELEVAKTMPAAKQAMKAWLAEHPEVARFVVRVEFDEKMQEDRIQRELDEHYNGTPLEHMAWCIENMRRFSVSGSRGVSKQQEQINNQLKRIARMVMHREVPGAKACENLAALTGNPSRRDLGQQMQEAYDWIKRMNRE